MQMKLKHFFMSHTLLRRFSKGVTATGLGRVCLYCFQNETTRLPPEIYIICWQRPNTKKRRKNNRLCVWNSTERKSTVAIEFSETRVFPLGRSNDIIFLITFWCVANCRQTLWSVCFCEARTVMLWWSLPLDSESSPSWNPTYLLRWNNLKCQLDATR